MFIDCISLVTLGIEVLHVESKQLSEGEQMRRRNPHSVPVELRRAGKARFTGRSAKPENALNKRKFLVPTHWTMGQFYFAVRRKIRVEAAHALFFFINNMVPSAIDTMGELYELYRDKRDNLLHILFSDENTFG